MSHLLTPARWLILAMATAISLACWGTLSAQTLLIEAESFQQPGGWKLDTQFIQEMNSPYLLAHGLGRPVKDATTEVAIAQSGEYRVLVRTMDWVARWQAEGSPGKFQLLVDGQPLPVTFGTNGAQWGWQAGGTVKLEAGKVSLALHDLTGFDGRCDAILLTADKDFQPPVVEQPLPGWRRKLLGVSESVVIHDNYDVVVLGGGYSGLGAAISAARMGCKVALIQNRGVLGGNGSSEVRVWAKGEIRRGKFPRIGEIIDELADHATKSPGRFEEFEDDKKLKIVQAEPNIDLFLNHHGFEVKMNGPRIDSVLAFDTRTSEIKQFRGRNFVDCTGHGTLGALAGADSDMSPDGRMGMSNMWRWDELDQPVAFPRTPWALDLTMQDFPYPRDHHGQWFWESGFDKDPLGDAEGIRDWNLRAVYGAFNAMKNRGGADQHRNAVLTWVAYIGGPRESRRLLGDVVLTEADIVGKRDFVDGTVPSTWSIDLHYPKQQYAQKYPDNPFISKAVHGQGVDRSYGYPVPYRCFYSRNVPNLFMAGRCISVTHEALGTVRVMKTCGMMGEVVGKAAALCIQHDCQPRDVYADHLEELKQLLALPGGARRRTIGAELQIPDVAEVPQQVPPQRGIALNSIEGEVRDAWQGQQQGDWQFGTGLEGFHGASYAYAPAESAKMTFSVPVSAGAYEVRLAYREHENRTTTAKVSVKSHRRYHADQIRRYDQARQLEGWIHFAGQVFTLWQRYGDRCHRR